ncbi:MAG TPA: hypothetical protein VMF65_01785 [Acidimicrobiales bacterium]|nr:hypothetical protein [Acidimicrobiales bacterium]
MRVVFMGRSIGHQHRVSVVIEAFLAGASTTTRMPAVSSVSLRTNGKNEGRARLPAPQVVV